MEGRERIARRPQIMLGKSDYVLPHVSRYIYEHSLKKYKNEKKRRNMAAIAAN